MSINSPYKKGGAKLAPAIASSPIEAAQTTREELIRSDLKVWLLLLLIICLAGLGSLSFFARSNFSTSSAYTDGFCVARPADIHYLTNTSSGTTNSVPPGWSQIGKTQQDLDNALACADSFTLTYETYAASDLKSLEASVSMLSAGAKMRFYTPGSQALISRMDPMWRATIQKQHIVRTAQIQQPVVIYSRKTNARVLIWITVPYVFTIKANSDTYSQNASLTVLLVSAPATMTSGTGWQVSDWNDHSGVFPEHDLL